MAAADSSAAPTKLVYVTDRMPGIRRVRRAGGFSYRGPDGRPVRDEAVLERIRRLAVPPAYEDVWICSLAHGHLQATGRDARGRKQYRYHAEWRSARDAGKFARMRDFGAVLPRIRRRVRDDLERHLDTPPARDAVLAALVRLLDATLLRIGNDEYARSNRSYGLTTLRNRHAAVQGATLRLRFRGKSGVVQDVALSDPRVARIVRRCQAMPGQDLFEYVDERGEIRCVGSADVNDYLREAAGADFTAKDFRTWHATVLALALLRHAQTAEAPGPRRANAVLAEVAAKLGNTVSVCKKAYVHPDVIELALRELSDDDPCRRTGRRIANLSADECALMAFLALGAAYPRAADTSSVRKNQSRASRAT